MQAFVFILCFSITRLTSSLLSPIHVIQQCEVAIECHASLLIIQPLCPLLGFAGNTSNISETSLEI